MFSRMAKTNFNFSKSIGIAIMYVWSLTNKRVALVLDLVLLMGEPIFISMLLASVESAVLV